MTDRRSGLGGPTGYIGRRATTAEDRSCARTGIHTKPPPGLLTREGPQLDEESSADAVADMRCVRRVDDLGWLEAGILDAIE